jgi:hypothetical protein
MGPDELVSSAAELALSLLEKNGSFLPNCKAVNEAGETIIYTPGDMPETIIYAPRDPLPSIDDEESGTPISDEEAYESVLRNVKKDLASRRLKGVAFCFHISVQLSPSEEKIPALKLEVHYKGLPAVIYYFIYKMEGSTAKVLEYYTNPARENLIP